MSSKKIYGECYMCNSELCGTVIEVAGRHYHNRCFYCCKCRKQLGHEEFRMRDERFFCIGCYSRAFERVCAECGEYILDDKFIEALNNCYHCDHFVCFLCKNGFPDSKFVRNEVLFNGEQLTRPLCLECHKKVKRTPCTKCHHRMGEVKAYDGENFFHDFCWLQDHPEDDCSGSLIKEAEKRYESERQKREEEYERRRKDQEELIRKQREEAEAEEKRKEEENQKRLEEQRVKREEERRKEEEERARREEEERKRMEEESRKRDEERQRREEDRRQKEEEKRMKEEEERRKKEEEKRMKEEEERMKEEKKQEEERQRREMAELYKTKSRDVDFHSDDDYEPVPETKPQRIIPSVPQNVPAQPVYKNSISAMLSDSYRPQKLSKFQREEESDPSRDLFKSNIYEYPQYDDYRKQDQRNLGLYTSENENLQEEEEEDLPMERERVPETVEEEDGVDEVKEEKEMKYNNVDEEYMKEQKRVEGLSNDQLKKYPLSVLKSQPLPKDVDPSRREYHLTDEEFKEVFNMDKKTFESLAEWKRIQHKKNAGLF